MTNSTTLKRNQLGFNMPVKVSSSGRYIIWSLNLLLGLMLTGPFLAPIFLAWQMQPFIFIGSAIYWLGYHICPQPELSIHLTATATSAVCSRCFAAAAGLTTWRILYARYPSFRLWFQKLSLATRFIPALVALLLWSGDIFGNKQALWQTDNPLMIITGFLLGLAVGSVVITFLLRHFSYSNTLADNTFS